MKQQYSLAHLTVLGCAPAEAVRIAADAGYDYVSLRLIPVGMAGERSHSLAASPGPLQDTKAALASTGMRVHDIEVARIDDAIDPRVYVPEFEVAAELGARAVVASISGHRRDVYVDKFGELCDLARPFGLTVDLEPVAINTLTNVAGALDVLHAVQRDNAGLLVDTIHFHYAGDDPDVLDRVPRQWLHFVQICDAPCAMPGDRDALVRIVREARLDLGTGGIDLARIMQHLPPVPYSVEQPNLARLERVGAAEHARRCLAAAKAYVEAHVRREVAQH